MVSTKKIKAEEKKFFKGMNKVFGVKKKSKLRL